MRAAVIGCGRMGAEPSARLAGSVPPGWLPLSHAEALQAVEGLALAAFCDTSVDVIRLRGRQYGVGALFTDHKDLIDTVRPDIVTIATRTPPKVGIVEYACRHGVKGVYVEKPLANDIGTCRRVLDEAATAGVAVFYGVNRRYHAAYREARALVRRGDIGEIVNVTIEHGRCQLLWAHPHSVDLALFFLEPATLQRVQASLAPDTVVSRSPLLVDSDPIIENAFFTFESGQTATIVSTGGLSVRISGTLGNVTVHADGSYIQVDRVTGTQRAYFLDEARILPDCGSSATVTAFTELRAAVAASDGHTPSTTHIDIGTRMLVGCVWSHLQGGRSIEASDLPTNLIVSGRYGDRVA